MTCDGCGRDVTLMDGSFCGHCTNTISAAVREAIHRTDILRGSDVIDAYRHKDGHIVVEIDDGR